MEQALLAAPTVSAPVKTASPAATAGSREQEIDMIKQELRSLLQRLDSLESAP
ncbi:hypothetical protein [Oceanicoccus sp. KOV_DT_Chl]|uniref:hypothetical protein n=1 Tax=Oceanicoccus sp. KOV_DT_Chl TaxID=1904639 RepID=UPI0013595930|nr:hypothetical protein [Oceanicoccus sp. KOV_DT_Chl]